ncbi:MAG: hypothetical protein QOH05_2258 [Acetobacteraceae bacterium]|nr:hypothetical protein [Acetobacteraceae bacterium]
MQPDQGASPSKWSSVQMNLSIPFWLWCVVDGRIRSNPSAVQGPGAYATALPALAVRHRGRFALPATIGQCAPA